MIRLILTLAILTSLGCAHRQARPDDPNHVSGRNRVKKALAGFSEGFNENRQVNCQGYTSGGYTTVNCR